VLGALPCFEFKRCTHCSMAHPFVSGQGRVELDVDTFADNWVNGCTTETKLQFWGSGEFWVNGSHVLAQSCQLMNIVPKAPIFPIQAERPRGNVGKIVTHLNGLPFS